MMLHSTGPAVGLPGGRLYKSRFGCFAGLAPRRRRIAYEHACFMTAFAAADLAMPSTRAQLLELVVPEC